VVEIFGVQLSEVLQPMKYWLMPDATGFPVVRENLSQSGTTHVYRFFVFSPFEKMA